MRRRVRSRLGGNGPAGTCRAELFARSRLRAARETEASCSSIPPLHSNTIRRSPSPEGRSRTSARRRGSRSFPPRPRPTAGASSRSFSSPGKDGGFEGKGHRDPEGRVLALLSRAGKGERPQGFSEEARLGLLRRRGARLVESAIARAERGRDRFHLHGEPDREEEGGEALSSRCRNPSNRPSPESSACASSVRNAPTRSDIEPCVLDVSCTIEPARDGR